MGLLGHDAKGTYKNYDLKEIKLFPYGNLVIYMGLMCKC